MQQIQVGDAVAQINNVGEEVEINLSSHFKPGTESEGYEWSAKLRVSVQNIQLPIGAVGRILVNHTEPHPILNI